MKLRYVILTLVLLLAASFPGRATKVNKADLEATHILVGNVEDVESFFGVNERGDRIILSRVRVKAQKWIKGDPSKIVEFVVEGGSGRRARPEGFGYPGIRKGAEDAPSPQEAGR